MLKQGRPEKRFITCSKQHLPSCLHSKILQCNKLPLLNTKKAKKQSCQQEYKSSCCSPMVHRHATMLTNTKMIDTCAVALSSTTQVLSDHSHCRFFATLLVACLALHFTMRTPCSQVPQLSIVRWHTVSRRRWGTLCHLSVKILFKFAVASFNILISTAY